MYRRALSPFLHESLRDTPVVFLAGARQTGKSTLARTLLLEGAWTYRTLDDLGVLASAGADPQGFLDSLGPRAILDEVQRVPGLLLAIKASVDRDRRPGRFVLTGSANVLTLPTVADNLVGRMEVMTLWPLAQAEVAGLDSGFIDACFQGHPESLACQGMTRAELLRAVFRGGYPEARERKREDARRRWFDAYLGTLIQRDVRELAAVEGIVHFPRLLQSLALAVGSPLNIAGLGRDLGMNQMTLKRYLGLLEALFLTVPLRPWFDNAGKRLAKAPKLYLNDAGLLAHLLGLDEDGANAMLPTVGPVLEAFAVMEIMKMAPWSVNRPGVSHMRTSAGIELDMVLENRRRELVGVEIKAATTISPSDFKGLKVLRELAGERMRCGVVLYTGQEVLPFGPGLWALPLQALWGR